MLRVPETWVEVGHVVVLESGQDTGVLIFLWVKEEAGYCERLKAVAAMRENCRNSASLKHSIFQRQLWLCSKPHQVNSVISLLFPPTVCFFPSNPGSRAWWKCTWIASETRPPKMR